MFYCRREQSLRLETRINHAGLVHVRTLHILRLAPSPGNCRCASAMHRRIAASRASPCCAVCVAAWGLVSITATNAPSRPSENWLVILIGCFLTSGCPNWAGSRRPVTVTKFGATAWMQPLRRQTRKPSMRLMDGGFIQIVRASSLRTAGSAHVSCTEDAISAPKTLWWSNHRSVMGLSRITLRYRSFVSDHALHVCEIGRSTRDAANAAPRRKCCHPPVTSAHIRACCR